MKTALLLEKDADAFAKTSQLLEWLGYRVIRPRNARHALHLTEIIKFETIVSSVLADPNDRRSLIGELKRLSSGSMIVLITECENDYRQAVSDNYAWVSAVLRRPPSLQRLRRTFELGVDGHGSHPVYTMPEVERRRRAVGKFPSA